MVWLLTVRLLNITTVHSLYQLAFNLTHLLTKNAHWWHFRALIFNEINQHRPITPAHCCSSLIEKSFYFYYYRTYYHEKEFCPVLKQCSKTLLLVHFKKGHNLKLSPLNEYGAELFSMIVRYGVSRTLTWLNMTSLNLIMSDVNEKTTWLT